MKRNTVLITGASRGIGRAAAAAFAENGYDLVLNCLHSASELELFSNDLKKRFPIRTLCCYGDIGDADFVRAMFHQTADFCGGIDILINNAGISHIGLLSDMTYKEWEAILHTNLTSVFLCCKYAIPYMVSQKSGKIINISSDWGLYGASCETAYSATKGGVNAFTKALAKELAPSNIQVNAVACGAMDTEMNRFLSEDEMASLLDEIPSGRLGRPEEAADLVYYLALENSYLTGQVIGLDGGWI